MTTWLILAGSAAILIASGSLCAKWSQSLNISILDYVTGYTLVQALATGLMWVVFTQTNAGRTLERSTFWQQQPNSRPAPGRPGSVWGWPQLITGIIFMIVSLLAVAAVRQAPNPGYASSVLSTSALMVALVAPLLFRNTSLSSTAFFGLLLVVVGITLVVRTNDPTV